MRGFIEARKLGSAEEVYEVVFFMKFLHQNTKYIVGVLQLLEPICNPNSRIFQQKTSACTTKLCCFKVSSLLLLLVT